MHGPFVHICAEDSVPERLKGGVVAIERDSRLAEGLSNAVIPNVDIIEADALIPELNSENLNTNIKGWELSLAVRIWPTITAFAQYGITEREDYDLNGFGRPSSRDPSFSGGQSMRIRLGIYLDF